MKKILTLFLFVVTLILLSFTGCKIKISVPEGGNVTTESGSYDCQLGQVCTIDVYDIFFDETFVAAPNQGYGFAKWKKRHKGLCGGRERPCWLSTTGFLGHDGLMKVLESDTVFYLEPVFAKPDVWSQLGDELEGETNFGEFGNSVSISADGTRLAIGASHYGENGPVSGQVRVYEWSGIAWQQLGGDINGERNDHSGWSVSLSAKGNRLAIGAPGPKYRAAGVVRVYALSGTSWTQLGEDIDGESADDLFGYSVSLSADGSRLAISGPQNDGNGEGFGHVRMYAWSVTGWQQIGGDIDGEGFRDNSGLSVSLSADGNRLAIGAPGNDGNGPQDEFNKRSFGHVRVYTWSGAVWRQLGSDINGEAAGDSSGYSVSLSANGSRLAIGAPFNGLYSAHGHVRVYAWSSGAWRQLGEDIDGERRGDRSGWSVSLSAGGNRLAIGAPENDGNDLRTYNPPDFGHVRVYTWSGTAWFQLGEDVDGQTEHENFGSTVSLSADGDRLASGAPGYEQNGMARVYGAPLE